MNYQIKHIGTAMGGSFAPYDRELFNNKLKSLEGKEIEIIIKERKPKASVDQHGYYRGGIIQHCKEHEMFAEMEDDEIHFYFSETFLSYKKMIKTPLGMLEKKYQTSTSKLNKTEMAAFIDKVLNFLSLHEIFPLTPDQYYLTKYKTIER